MTPVRQGDHTQQSWQFWIDVGGTFTDCIARDPDGRLRTCKTLSSGRVPGRVAAVESDGIVDPLREGDPAAYWTGYTIRFAGPEGGVIHECRVSGSSSDGRLTLSAPLPPDVAVGCRYELSSGEEAPIVAIRQILGLSLQQPIPSVSVRLGTTRGTNALLERKGARTGFLTTRGFADLLRIGNQDRPRLFDLAIQKPEPLFTRVVEVDERLDADGNVITPLDPDAVRRQLTALKSQPVDSLAICLLHAYRNPAHEQVVAQIAAEVGFDEISTSSEVAPRIKFVSRGDTTVLDAYLNPVLRQYVQRIGHSLGNSATLKLMTSAGGLLNAASFRGSESIVSGPAGGVVGYANVARQAGFERAIGFDMGGTSTDVSRFDGRFELDFETQKAGVRIMTPTLAIETVAAGGGSLCQFDGVKLAVGPESAGADPGPACYGRGGPLTVTDVNLYLGRIPVDEFPFPLDRDAVQRHLEQMCAQIADSPLGRQYTPSELAAGFVEIANANMTRAIRRISVAKGYDPADYVLVTFGGAGGQHACAIARMLGVRQILLHPFAGILSAYGIGLADVRRHREAPVLGRIGPQTLAELEPTFLDLEQAAVEEVRQDGIRDEQIDPPLRSLDMRYEGIESTLTIPQPADGDYRAAYEALHQQMFGYRRDDRPVEVVAARVEVVGRTPHEGLPVEEATPRFPQPDRVQTVTFGETERSTGIFHRRNLQAGDELVGPAILCEPTSTVVIDPGFTATITGRGDVLIRDVVDASGGRVSSAADGPASAEPAESDPASSRSRKTSGVSQAPNSCESGYDAEPDPAQLEIFNNQFASIAEQMGVILQKTALSTNVKERLDFSCAVFDAEGGLVVNAPHIPVHLGAMSETVRRVLADNPDLAPGDVIVTNDPYRGGSHLPDITVVTPMHDEEGRLQFVTASRAHHAEIGGITPGSMPPFSKTLAEEGVLIRNFKLVAAGASRSDQLRELLTSGEYPSRSPDDNLADITAQVAANRAGVRLLEDLVRRNGAGTVHSYMKHIQRAAAAKMRMALAARPDGRTTFTDHLDDGSPISVAITIAGDRATVDFTGTGPVLSTNLNANRAIVTAACLYVFRCLIAEDIPLNGGVLEPIDIVLPECLLNPPEHDDLTFGDTSFGYYETICGGSGATADADGADAVHTHMTNTRLTDVEVIERRYPVRVEEFSIRRESGGSGRHRGGDGIVRRIRFLRPLHVSLLTQRRGPYAPFGLAGGESGQLGSNSLLRARTDESVDIGGCGQVAVEQDDVLVIQTPGGGGFGLGVK
jgi:5-oxoprolinase (ATP-hydrolysing)